jgi:hypothetical protein
METNDDPLAQFGLDAIDLRWIIAAKAAPEKIKAAARVTIHPSGMPQSAFNRLPSRRSCGWIAAVLGGTDDAKF